MDDCIFLLFGWLAEKLIGMIAAELVADPALLKEKDWNKKEK